MAAGVNRVILIGHLGSDPEVRYAQSGTALCTLRLGVTERVKNGDKWEDATAWVDAVTFGKTAENAGQYLQKGRQVYVEGRLRTREYTDKDNNKRQKTEVVANTVLFLGGKDGGGERPAAAGKPGKASGAPSAPEDTGGGSFIDDDLPFARCMDCEW